MLQSLMRTRIPEDKCDRIIKSLSEFGVELNQMPKATLGDNFFVKSKYNTLVKIENFGRDSMELIPYFSEKDVSLKYIFTNDKLYAISDKAESYINPDTGFLNLSKLSEDNLDYYIENRGDYGVVGLLNKVESSSFKNTVDFLQDIKILAENMFQNILERPNYMSVIKCYDDHSLNSIKEHLKNAKRFSKDLEVYHTGIYEFIVMSKTPIGHMLINDTIFTFKSKPITDYSKESLNGIKSGLFTEISSNRSEEEENILKGYFKALYNKTDETIDHCERMRVICALLGEELLLTPKEMDTLSKMASIHDIGKISIEGKIINKPGKLDEDEFNMMKKHTVLGYEMMNGIKSYEDVKDVCLYHHERWDGKGYPNGLKENEIPLLIRIVAVADAIDAMASRRIYKEAFDFDFIRQELELKQGTQFCPQVVKVSLDTFDKIEKLY